MRRPTAQLRVLPHEPGVYRFRDGRGRLRYIGRAADLRERVSSYWSDLGDRRRLRTMVAAVTRIEAVVCASRHEAAWLERLLLETQQAGPGLPDGNLTAGGQESPVWLQLDERAPSAGLTVRHAMTGGPGTRSYGPYLGGLQVRRALSGLERVLPLGYTATGLSAAGLGLAEIRSVTPADRPRLAAELSRLLAGDAAAAGRAATRLLGFRADASAARAYELAGRITAEIAALDWVCSEQRVNCPGTGDHRVSGWCDGVLVDFQIVAGRLTGWEQRRCSAGEAAGPVARTRPGWHVFANRNAELAAALAAQTLPG